MAEENVIRKLAAILYADVAGYSRLTGADEVGTHRRLGAGLDLISDAIGEKDGRVVHYAGDAVLAEVGSVVAAVDCAVAVQRELAERNADVPEDQRLQFRIGVNLGEVIVDRDDIYGDGVNVAARLESLADSGGICISEKVHQEIRGKLDLAFEDMGAQKVKNIAEPVRAYRIVPGEAGPRPPAQQPAGEGALEPPQKPSIAVLPFANMSGDAEQEYFSDGISEDIITDLSKVSALFVIARNSSFAYKGKSVNVRQVATDLGVRYVLEGSVRKAANRVRVTAQLVDGATGGHLWADRYDRDLEDIFAVQDEVTRHIVDALKVALTPDERQRMGGQGTADMEAYDLTLRGRDLAWRFTPGANAEAVRLFEQAIVLDPEFSLPYSGMSLVLIADYTNGWNAPDDSLLERCVRLAEKAVALDDAEPQGYRATAVAHLWNRDLDRAAAAAEKALALDPNHAMAHSELANVYAYAGRSGEAIELMEKAMRLDPQYPDLCLHFLAHAHFMQGHYEEAAAVLKRRIRRNPETDISRVLLASCWGHLGDPDEARREWAEALKINPDYSLDHKAQVLPYKDPADWERMVDGLKKARLPE